MKTQACSSSATSGIQSGPDALRKSRAVMTFVPIFEVTGSLCNSDSSKWERKENISTEKLYFVRCRKTTLVCLLKTLLTWTARTGLRRGVWQTPLFFSIGKFGELKNPFTTIISLCESFCKHSRFVLCLKTNELISLRNGRSTSSRKLWWWLRLSINVTKSAGNWWFGHINWRNP